MNTQTTANNGSITKKKLGIIGGAIIVILLLVGGWLFYSTPKRVMADTLTKVLTAESAAFNGTLQYTDKTSENFSLEATFATQTNQQAASTTSNITLKREAVSVQADIAFVSNAEASYIKFGNAQQLGNLAVSLLEKDNPFAPTISAVAADLNNNWIKIPGGQTTQSKCLSLITHVQFSMGDRHKLREAFFAHQFLTGEPIDGAPSNHQTYKLQFDGPAAEQFISKTLQIPSIAAINAACDAPADDVRKAVAELESQQSKLDIQLTVNSVTHEPTRIVATFDDTQATLKTDIAIELGAKTNIELPTESLTLDDVIRKIIGGSLMRQPEYKGGLDSF